jgi:dienelactone hydrolase
MGTGDLYMPGSGENHSAVLLFLGVNPAGRDDPRVVGLANALGRSGTVVLIPWSESMRRLEIDPAEVENLVHAYQYLIGLEQVDPQRAGMGGFCVGASFATVAAQDERIRDDVRFVNFFGGYYDAFDLIKAVVTESRFSDGEVQPWVPDSLSRQVVVRQLIDGLPDGNERGFLERRFIDGVGDVSEAPSSLSAEAQAVYTLLDGPRIDEVDALFASLPAETLESLEFISPAARVSDLNARMLMMHDREDPLVPSEESSRFAQALTEQGGDVYHTEFSFFQHVDPTRPVGLPTFVREASKLYLHMYQVLREL